MIKHLRWFSVAAAGLIAGCALQPLPDGPCPCPGLPAVAPRVNALEPVDFGALTGWKDGEQAAAWPALLSSCQALRWREAWRGACARAMELRSPGDEEARRFLEENFTPWRLANPDGTIEGLVTGYYEPLLRGSRAKATPYVFPVYGPPDDLLTIDLSATNPELRGMRLRGRVDGKRVVPYYSRAEIARGAAPVAGKEILWVDDPIEAFFLQIQGSGRIQLEGGETLRLGYADQNGHPFQSIGRYLVERGELKLNEASMSSIKSWAAANPKRLEELLNQNPSFFANCPSPTRRAGPWARSACRSLRAARSPSIRATSRSGLRYSSRRRFRRA
jgi:membrane-bound lytic murein transglycosylase A